MKIIKFLLSLLVTFGIVYMLNKPYVLQKPSANDPAKMQEVLVPPPGSFFSPFSGFWQNAESLTDFISRKIEVPGMKGKVKIQFDERLVPHIFAENLEDAMFAQGYVVAMFRLWQMDMISRLSGGELAEVMGKDLLENDKLQRRRGMLHGAQQAEKAWRKSPEEYKLIEAYANGVNQYVQQLQPNDIPLEFKLLHYQPQNWSALKSALVKKYMDFTLCFGEDDLELTNALQILGRETFEKLYPEYNPRQTPVIPAGTRWDFKASAPAAAKKVEEAVGLQDHDVYEKERSLVGSNNWAVAGSKTKNGKPILCNDPHLQLSLPSIWFEIQIHTPEMNAYGVCIPGMPGVIIGFNENIAWGVTNVGHDVLDWFKINWTDAARSSYSVDGKVKKARQVVEQYKVRSSELPVFDTVTWTDFGPVVYESGNGDNERNDLAMRWLAHDEPNPKDLSAFLGLDKGKNYDDYAKALENYDFPAQNFAFASKSGDIAMTVNGKFPIKRNQQGRFVQDGGNSSNDWAEFIPRSQLPRMKNPVRSFVASANQHSTDPSYPYYYNSTHFDDYRARYLVGQLSSMDSITVDEMKALQNSNYSIHAAEALPLLLNALDTTQLDAAQMGAVKKLRAWNFNFDGDKTEPVMFFTWWERFCEYTLDEVLVYKDSIELPRPDNWRVVELLRQSPKDAIFDDKKTPATETAKEIAQKSLSKALADMLENMAKGDVNWAAHKGTAIMHLTRIPAFSRMNLAVGGYEQALNAISPRNGPSWRMVVEMGDEVKAWGVFPGGQSGNPGSPFYDTGIEKWSKGEYNELFFMKTAADDRQKVLFSLDIN